MAGKNAEETPMPGRAAIEVQTIEVDDITAPGAGEGKPVEKPADEDAELEEAIVAAEEAQVEDDEDPTKPVEVGKKPKEKKPEVEAPPPDDGLIEDFEDPSPEEAVSPPVENAPAVKPEELKKLEAELAEHRQPANFGRFVDGVIVKDKLFEMHFLEALERQGNLAPEHLAKLIELRKTAPRAIPTNMIVVDGVPVTDQQASKYYTDLRKSGKEWEAAQFLNKFENAKKELAERPAREAARVKAAEEAAAKQRESHEQQVVADVQSQLAGLAEKLGPKVLAKGKDGVVRFTDAALYQKFKQNCDGLSPKAKLADVMRFTLFKLGRLKPAPKGGKVAAKAPPAPPIPRGARSKTAPANASTRNQGRPGMTAVKVDVEER